MATRTKYQKHINELNRLFVQNERPALIQQGERNLRDFAMPPLWRNTTICILARAEDDWHKAEGWRLKGESEFESLPKAEEIEENNSELRRDMRVNLDHLHNYQADDARKWSWHSPKPHPPAASLGAAQDRPTQLIDGEDEGVGSDEEDEDLSQSTSANDCSDDEYITTEDYLAYKAEEAVATEKAVAEESAKVGKKMEETQLGVVDETRRDEGIVSPARKPANGTKDSFVTRKTTVTRRTTLTENGGVTTKTVVRTKTVVTREKILSKERRSGD